MHISNQNVMDLDWSYADRQKMLRSITSSKVQPIIRLAPGVVSTELWMNDVSIVDKRSVKAQLAGRGDYRAMWWNINRFLYHVISRNPSLEWAMYNFHHRHQVATTIVHEWLIDYRILRVRMAKQGIASALLHIKSVAEKR